MINKQAYRYETEIFKLAQSIDRHCLYLTFNVPLFSTKIIFWLSRSLPHYFMVRLLCSMNQYLCSCVTACFTYFTNGPSSSNTKKGGGCKCENVIYLISYILNKEQNLVFSYCGGAVEKLIKTFKWKFFHKRAPSVTTSIHR